MRKADRNIAVALEKHFNNLAQYKDIQTTRLVKWVTGEVTQQNYYDNNRLSSTCDDKEIFLQKFLFRQQVDCICNCKIGFDKKNSRNFA